MSQRIVSVASALVVATAGMLARPAHASQGQVAPSVMAETNDLVAQAKAKSKGKAKAGGATGNTKGGKKAGKGANTDSAVPVTAPPAATPAAGKGKAGKTTTPTSGTAPTPVPVQPPVSTPPPAPPAQPAKPGEVLDLSKVNKDQSEAARQEVLSGQSESKVTGQAIDFGVPQGKDAKDSSNFDFGEVELDMGKLEAASAENQRFEKALGLMSDEKYQ